jgi:hypothetical protein
MLHNLDDSGRTEVAFINGSVVGWGEKFSVPSPVTRALVACAKGVEFRTQHFQGNARRPHPRALPRRRGAADAVRSSKVKETT